MRRKWQREGAEAAKPIWRVPGLNIVRTRSWAPVTVQEVESAGGEGVWRSDKHRLSPLMGEAAQFAVQFDSGPAREFRGPGPRLFFCPAGATMQVRSGLMRWIQAVQEPGLWLPSADEVGGSPHALEPDRPRRGRGRSIEQAARRCAQHGDFA